MAGATPRDHPGLEHLPGPAALLTAPQPGRAVPAPRPQRGVLPEQLCVRVPGPHPVLRVDVPHATGGSGRLLWCLLHPLFAHVAVQVCALRPRGEPCPSVCSSWGRLLSLLLARRRRLSCLLGPGSHPRGHQLPCRLAPDRDHGRGRAADGAGVKHLPGPASLPSQLPHLCTTVLHGSAALARGPLPIPGPGRDPALEIKLL